MFKKVLLHIVFVLLLGGISKAAVSEDTNYGDDGGKNKNKENTSLFSKKTDKLSQSLSLKSGIEFRGDNIFSKKENTQTINLKTFVTYSNGHNTITLPYKKLAIVGRITLNSELRR